MSNYEELTKEYFVDGENMQCFCNAKENIDRENERFFLCQMTEPYQQFWYNPKTNKKDLSYKSEIIKVDIFIVS